MHHCPFISKGSKYHIFQKWQTYFKKFVIIFLDGDSYYSMSIGAARADTGNVPPEIENNCSRKTMIFRKALFLATTFPKIDKNSIFLMNSNQKISKFSRNFQTIYIFRPNEGKSNAGFVKFCGNMAKIMHFCYFLTKFPNNCVFRQNALK